MPKMSAALSEAALQIPCTSKPQTNQSAASSQLGQSRRLSGQVEILAKLPVIR